MPDPFGVSQVGEDEHEAHDDGGDGQGLGGEEGWGEILAVEELDCRYENDG